jgi:hypothetical protein
MLTSSSEQLLHLERTIVVGVGDEQGGEGTSRSVTAMWPGRLRAE